MIKLNFANRTAGNLGDVFAIPPKRQDEIAFKLDQMVNSYTKPTLVYMADILDKIQGFCETDEEFIWAITNHISWLAATGRMLPPMDAAKAVNQFKAREQN